MKRVGWTMSVLLALFMLAGSAAPKLLGAQAAADAMAPLGWPLDKLIFIGLVELVGTVLFLIPRTALWGAILLTGLFGAAIGSHWRVASPMFSHTLFGAYLGVWMWGALALRDDAVRKLFSVSRRD
jgi:uncharacterized membrane protein YphA (DoxX/SURF4 family)